MLRAKLWTYDFLLYNGRKIQICPMMFYDDDDDDCVVDDSDDEDDDYKYR